MMMTSESSVRNGGSGRAPTGVVLGGLAAGILDIIYAFIASGLRGGSPLALVKGFVSHRLLVDIPIALFIRHFSISRPAQVSESAH